ncbi:hypothetical protein [Pseudomonas maioricensis]|nr:hypothetical protein [Pseudomonas sp. S25]
MDNRDEDHQDEPVIERRCANDHPAEGTVQRGGHYYCTDCDEAGRYLP